MENAPDPRPAKAARRVKLAAVLAALLAALAALDVLPPALVDPLAEVGGFVLANV